MKRVRWELEEAVALMDVYFRYGGTLKIPENELLHLSQLYRNRAKILGLQVDEKFRNLAGMQMQIGCIHYVVTDGKEGLSAASRLLYQTYELYKNRPDDFRKICDEFHRKYEE